MSLPVVRKLLSLRSGDAELKGVFESLANPQGVVVFAFGSGLSHMDPRNRFVAIELRRLGFATLLADLLSDREALEDPARHFDVPLLTHRLQILVRWNDANAFSAELPVGLFGVGTGSAAALHLAYKFGDAISAVVSRSARADGVNDTILAGIRTPTLFVVGGRDDVLAEANRAAYAKLRCMKSFHVVPAASESFEEPGTLEALTALAADWFSRFLRREPRAA